MDQEKIEEEMKKIVRSLDQAARLEAVLKEGKEYRLILSKGTHSERAVIAEDLMEDFLERGKRGHEVKKAVGKVVSMLTLMGQRRG
jgi:alpha-galactosidase